MRNGSNRPGYDRRTTQREVYAHAISLAFACWDGDVAQQCPIMPIMLPWEGWGCNLSLPRYSS